jgi:tol-pal system protein YbgF
MRPFAALLACGLLAGAASNAAAGPPRPPSPERHAVTPVQERFLPRFFGGANGEDRQRERQQADMQLRIEQLEQQVRMLTGQVEDLTFTVRRLEAALSQRGILQSEAETTGPTAEASAPSGGDVSEPTGRRQTAGSTGPVDLSALNRGVTEPVTPSPARQSAEPPTNPALEEARRLQASGRYAMAEQKAREILTDNPTGPVAGEARYLLGEALLAQGAYRGAANLFLENYTTDPNGARAPESLLKLSVALNGLGEREAACSSLEELFGAYPNIGSELRTAAEQERRAAGCA